MTKRKWLAMCLAFSLLLLTACGKPAGEGDEETISVIQKLESSTSFSSESASQVETNLGEINPLTGEGGYNEEAVGKRPVAVMVNNIGQALPQRGLAEADILYEVVVEGGITRLMAVYADPYDIPYVGPVRSARHYYISIALPMNALYVHFGGSPAAYQYISQYGVDDVDGMYTQSGVFYQDMDRAAAVGREHSFFINGESILSVLEGKGVDIQGETAAPFAFAEEEISFEEKPATQIFIRFSSGYNSGFTYDEESKLYQKQRNGEDHIDGDTGECLTYRNVILLFTSVTSYNGEAERREVSFAGGDGYYMTDGGIVPIHWEKGGVTDPFTFTNADGTPLEVNVGKSYIALTDESQRQYFTYNQ